MITPCKLQFPYRILTMRVLWWCHVGEMKKVKFVTLGMRTLVDLPLCRGTFVGRDVKHSTSA